MATVTTVEPVVGRRMTNREVLMQSLEKEFQDASKFETLDALVDGTSGVSLRLLDYFLCHYSLLHNVQYSLPGEVLPFHVHDEYDQRLNSYGKVLFDCFGRKQRSVLTRGEKTIKTSAGQAHMVSWAIDKGVMAYVTEHAAAVRQQLKAHSKKTRQAGGKRKNKAVVVKKDVTDRAFAMPMSWHGGRTFKMCFSLKRRSSR